jgi:hypothetical protein
MEVSLEEVCISRKGVSGTFVTVPAPPGILCTILLSREAAAFLRVGMEEGGGGQGR